MSTAAGAAGHQVPAGSDVVAGQGGPAGSAAPGAPGVPKVPGEFAGGAARVRTGLPPGAAFRWVTAAFAVLMAFGTVPTPLWPLYQARDGFGATTVTVAFAVMVVGAAGSFLGFGHLSDRLGRLRVIVPALLVGIAAAVILAVWPALPGLIVGRLLTGVAVGLMASTATAYLNDLYHAAHPDRAGSGVPGLVATAANLGGLAFGPLVAGAAAQWLGAPLHTSYVAFAAVLAVLALLVARGPETVDRERVQRDRPVRFELRPGGGPMFGAASSIGFFAFAVMGLFSSLGVIIVRGQLGISSYFVAGLVPFVAFAASAAAQTALSRLAHVRLLATGTLLFPAGLALTAVSLYHPRLWIALVAAALAGAGAGLLFKGAVSQTFASAAAASRAGVLAAFFVIAYLGMGLPSIAFSLVIQHTALRPTMIGFAAVLSVGAAAAVAVAVKGGRAVAR